MSEKEKEGEVEIKVDNGGQLDNKEIVEPVPEITSAIQPEDQSKSSSSSSSQRHLHPPIPPVPEGMTKSAWKKELRRKQKEATRDEWIQKRKEKRKQVKQERKRQRQEEIASGQPVTKKTKRPDNQKRLPIKVIIDCGFDELMEERERKSLAVQISRCYAMNKQAVNSVNLEVTSLNKQLKERFYGPMQAAHLQWEGKGISFKEDDYQVPDDENEKSRILYFSSDSTNTIETLEENMTYIIGGIVDKGRYKNLCNDKASKQNIKTAKLPIDEYIKLSGRRVLTTNHVFELVLKWLEVKDWKLAFETILPSRKLNPKVGSNVNKDDDDNSDDNVDGNEDDVEELQKDNNTHDE